MLPSDLGCTEKDLTGREHQKVPTDIKKEHTHNVAKVELIASDDGPKIYHVKGKRVSPPFITGKLPEAFSSLSVFETPEGDLEEHKKAFMAKFFRDLDDEQFGKLAQYCSPENLMTGREMTMLSEIPLMKFSSTFENKDYFSSFPGSRGEGNHLETIKQLQLRSKMGKSNTYTRLLKYRGIRFIPLPISEAGAGAAGRLRAGVDLLYRVRVYRPFPYSPLDSRRELFPSNFLFINNVFYVDTRAGCRDLSKPLRAWARRRHLGDFPVRDMATITLDQLTLRLGYPEVFVHQGDCEHLFTFSQVRVATSADRVAAAALPAHSIAAHAQAAHCSCCERDAELVVGSGAEPLGANAPDLPFNPALLCAICADLYLYAEPGVKRTNFKLYQYLDDDGDQP